MRGKISIWHIAVICILILALTLAIGTVGIWYESNDVLGVLVDQNNQNVELAGVWEELQQMDTICGNMLFFQQYELPQARADFLAGVESTQAQLKGMMGAEHNAHYYALCDILHMIETYATRFETYYTGLNEQQAGVYLRSMRNDLKTLTGYIGTELGEVIVDHLNQSKDATISSLKRMNETRSRLVVFFLLCILVCALVLVFFVTIIIRPIRGLIKRMNCFRNTETAEAGLPAAKASWREMRQLNESFDTMVAEIVRQRESERRMARLEINNTEMKYQLDRANLDMLQAQVNPHFLFNTLNSIYALTIKENAADSGEMVAHLAGILRYSMSSMNSFVEVSRDLEVLGDYISIQKIRFGDTIRFTVEVAEGLESAEIPSLMIQPLVENSIMHAFTPPGNNDEIHISISRRGEDILIEVRDNGSGISTDKLERIHAGEKVAGGGEDVHHGIGLDNVIKRMNILYGEGHVQIDSRAGSGTRITLIISKDGNGEKGNDEKL